MRGAEGDVTAELRADCGSCAGLCCVALAFTASSDFAVDKRVGEPCGNLKQDHRCGIHRDLRQRGYSGCTVYDCFGAGQKVTQETYDGQGWRDDPDRAREMFAVFPVVRQLHELLWYLSEAVELPAAKGMRGELRRALETVARLADGTPQDIAALDVAARRQEVNVLLLRVGELVRAPHGKGKRDRRGADLIGARLKGADLRGANLRGSYLIGADLRGADLRGAELIGADLRDTDLRGADLTGAVFVTQTQVNAARGDDATRLPPRLARPAHWS
ncbi:pentapeptide repeat-containing protein [Streptomyces lasiicapitis]|uniref:pentapeptide repeat-containing protein n=1 Tax=Streptomyces lasiicapitis TaxID=1923961 RepID=UPI003674F40C